MFFGVSRFHAYIYDCHFTLVTDHKPLLDLSKRIDPYPYKHMVEYNDRHQLLRVKSIHCDLSRQKPTLMLTH